VALHQRRESGFILMVGEVVKQVAVGFRAIARRFGQGAEVP
jgi:hypothetical protein